MRARRREVLRARTLCPTGGAGQTATRRRYQRRGALNRPLFDPSWVGFHPYSLSGAGTACGALRPLKMSVKLFLLLALLGVAAGE